MNAQKYTSRIRICMLALMLSFSVLALFPVGAFAQTTPTTTGLGTNVGASNLTYDGSYCSTAVSTISTFSDLFKYFTCSLERLVLPLLFTIAGLVFIWGTVKFIASRDSSEKEQGQQFMLWGVIGFAVMLSLWGLVNILGVTFKINNTLPIVPTTTQIQ